MQLNDSIKYSTLEIYERLILANLFIKLRVLAIIYFM